MKFEVGLQVEACSFQRGYEGAWFEGIILSCERDHCNVLFEQYRNEDGNGPLVERTEYHLLRPRPPPTTLRNWAVGDLVEANENDAWWRGIVTQVLPAQQYRVVFPDTASENIFHQSNMRVRQDWENGKWHLPWSCLSPTPSRSQGGFGAAKKKFKARMKVETCSLQQGYEGAWFEGIIVSSERDHCNVLFEKYRNEDGDGPLVEKTEYYLLRPCPPPINLRNWAVGDLVEANENDAWWRGIVTQVLPAQQYHVVFPDTKSENVFHQSNMRVRQDWDNGKWHQPSAWSSPTPTPSPSQEITTDNFIHKAHEIAHELEVNAYGSVLRAFLARKTLSLEKRLLLSHLRVALHINDEELEKLNLTSGFCENLT